MDKSNHENEIITNNDKSEQNKESINSPLTETSVETNNEKFRVTNGQDKKLESEEALRLLKYQDVPHHLQFNPYVLTGYRPQLNFWESVRSLKYYHNETVNILSHGLPLIYAILTLPYLLPWDRMTVPLLPYFHAASTISPWLGSSLYHLFMNHYSGSSTYKRLLQWDVVGVWVTQTFGALTTLYAAVLCLPQLVQFVMLTFYMLLAWRTLYESVFATGPWARRNSFAAMFIVRIFILGLRFTPFGGGHPEALRHVILQDLWTLIGAVISACQIPERWLPGRFDFHLNSHNIMHCVVVLAGFHMQWGAVKDLDWIARNIETCHHVEVEPSSVT